MPDQSLRQTIDDRPPILGSVTRGAARGQSHRISPWVGVLLGVLLGLSLLGPALGSTLPLAPVSAPPTPRGSAEPTILLDPSRVAPTSHNDARSASPTDTVRPSIPPQPGGPATSSPEFAPTSQLSWSNLTNASATPSVGSLPSPYVPAPRVSPNLVYDPVGGFDLMFGGNGGWVRQPDGTFVPGHAGLDDTWTFANGAWHNITAAGPAPSAGAETMAYDASDQVVLLYDYSPDNPTGSCGAYNDSNHIYNTDLANCTWEFADGHWAQLTGLAPTGVGGAVAMTYDSEDGYALAVGDDPVPWTYSFHDGVWTNQTRGAQPESGDSPVVGFSQDSAVGGPVFFGGSSASGSAMTTWKYSAGEWTNLTSLAGTAPSPRNTTSMADDPALSGAVLYGGHGGGFALGPSLNDTWSFGPTGWSNLTRSLGRGPPPLAGAGLTWDPTAQELLLFGGTDFPFDAYAATPIDQTWVLANTSLPGSLELTAAPDPADEGVPVQFAASFSGGTGPFSYAWEFGDGNASSSASPVHAYDSTGRFTVSLTVQDSLGHSTSAEMTVQIVAPLHVTASITPDPTEVGVSTSFDVTAYSGSDTEPNSTTSSLTEVWSYGDGTPPESGGVHTYLLSGNFTVALWVNDSGGGAYAQQWTLWVHPALALPGIAATPTTPSLGQLVNFSVSPRGGAAPYTYLWQFGDGGIGGDVPAISHVYTTNGPFLVQVTITDGLGAVARGSLNLSVALNLTVVGEWSAGAAPLPVTFMSQIRGGTPGYTYLWQFGDGGSSDLADPSHMFTTPGYYEPILTVTDAVGHTAQASWPIYIAAGGGALNVSLVASPPTIPLGGYTIVTASVSGGEGGYTFQWAGGTGACTTQGVLSERCTGTTAGSFPLQLTLTGSQAGSSAATTTIVVAGHPTPTGPAPGVDLLWVEVPVVLLLAAVLGGIVLTRSMRSQASRGPPGPDVNREYRTPPTTAAAGPTSPTVRKPGPGTGPPPDDPMRDLV